MPGINYKQNILPHIISIIVFLVIVIFLFKPVFFENKSLFQHDIYQWFGGAKELIDHRKETGEEGLWASSMFSGMPGYLVNLVFSGDLIVYIQKVIGFGLSRPADIVFTSLLSYYILLLAFGVRPWLAMAGAIAFGLSSFNIIGLEAGHNARINAIAFMPLVIAGIHLSFRKSLLLGAAILAAGLALQLRVNHLQITYYTLLISIFYGFNELYYSYKEGRLKEYFKIILFLVLAVVIAIGANLGRIWTVYEYSKYTIRGESELTQVETSNTTDGLSKDYAFQYSNGIFEPLVLLIPNFYGGSSQQELSMDSNIAEALRRNGMGRSQISQQIKSIPTYWGDQPITAPYYAGSIVVFLFLLGALLLSRQHKIWLISLVIFAIILSWGKNFSVLNNFMFDYFPGYNKFRSVTFTIIIAIFSMALLGFSGLENLLKTGFRNKTQKKFLMALGIVGGFCLLAFLLAGIGSYRGAVDSRMGNLPEWFLQALREDRAHLLRMDALRSLFFITGSAGLIYFYIKKKISKFLFFIGINVFVIFDMFFVAKRFLGEEDFRRVNLENQFQANEADKFILQDTSIKFRVYNLQNPFNEARTSYFHNSIGGYHGAKMRRYQDLIEYCIQSQTNQLINDLQRDNAAFANYGVLNMLNTKYLLAGTSENAVIENPAANGNAWLVSSIQKVNSPDEEIQKTCTLNSKNTAVIDASKFQISKNNFNSNGEIKLIKYDPDHLVYEANLSGESFIVFSEIYYPKGWKAEIDDTEAVIYRVNYVLRGLQVPAGNHRIEFKFEPISYKIGNKVMLGFSLILILGLVGIIGFTFYRNVLK